MKTDHTDPYADLRAAIEAGPIKGMPLIVSEATVARLLEERDAAVADARRYRWLRNANMDERNRLEHYASVALDAAIDAALERGES